MYQFKEAIASNSGHRHSKKDAPKRKLHWILALQTSLSSLIQTFELKKNGNKISCFGHKKKNKCLLMFFSMTESKQSDIYQTISNYFNKHVILMNKQCLVWEQHLCQGCLAEFQQ